MREFEWIFTFKYFMTVFPAARIFYNVYGVRNRGSSEVKMFDQLKNFVFLSTTTSQAFVRSPSEICFTRYTLLLLHLIDH